MSSGYLRAYLILTVLAVLVNWPGRVSPDTVDMLWQAQHPESITDWHSPFITFSYSILWPLFGYPGGALVIQSMLLMLWPASVTHGLLVSQTHYFTKLLFFIVWLVVCVIMIALAGQIVKDVFIAGIISSIFYLGGWLGATYDEDIGEIPFLIYALGLSLVLSRITNLVVLFACVAALVGFIFHKSKWKRQYGLYMMVMVLSVGLAVASVSYMFGAKNSQPERSPVIFDLAGISYYSGVNQFILDSEAKFNKSPIECYTAKQSDPFIWGPCSEYDLYLRPRKGILKDWIFAILNHPVAYLTHRMRFAVELLKRDGGGNEVLVSNPPFEVASNTEKYSIILPGNRLPLMQEWRPTIGFVPFGMISGFILSSPCGHPLFWCLTLIVNLVFMFRCQVQLVPLLLSVAGLSNVIAFILLSGSDDLRYLLPTFLCSLAVLVYWGGKIMGKYHRTPPMSLDA
jgi:hypothetical protein